MNPNVTDYLFEAPEGVTTESLPESAQSFMVQYEAEWPANPAIGTHSINGRVLLHVRLKLQLDKAQTDAKLAEFGLDWVTLGIRSAYAIDPVVTGQDKNGIDVVEYHAKTFYFASKDALLPYMNDIVGHYDTNGDPVIRAPTIDDPMPLPVYAGTEAIEL